MVGLIEAVAAELGQIDAAHEGELVVDDNELLVVAVNRVFTGIKVALDSRAGAECVADLPHGLPGWFEHRRWRARPEQKPDGASLRDLREEIAERTGVTGPGQLEIGAREPARDVHMGSRGRDRLRD